jgi:hypothetical protein
LLVSPSHWNFLGAGDQNLHAMTAHISWTDSPYLAEDWNVPISRLIDMGVIDPAYSRYASFSVQAIYQGDKRQYQALFLFSDDPEKKSTVLPFDQIIGVSALQALSADQSLPEPLLAQAFRGRPEVSSFIEWWRAQPGCSTDAVTGMCCDPATQQCGVSSKVLQMKGFGAIQSSSVLPQVNCGPACSAFNTSTDLGFHSDVDTTLHLTGNHFGAVEFTGDCSYTGSRSPCAGVCNVTVNPKGLGESGFPSTFCHVIASVENGQTTAAVLPCSGSWGYAVKSCFGCLCGVSLTVNTGVGPVTVNSQDALHTWGWGAQWTCPTH